MADGIRIVTVGGSVRPGNFTAKALAVVHDEIERRGDIALDHVDPATLELPLPGRPATADAAALQERIGAATAVILATPEYHGSYSSVMKLVIDNLGFPSALGAKPVALLGVAGGAIGAIKALEHLRSVASHVGAVVMPSVVSVAGVQRAFDASGACTDAGVEKRLRGLVDKLLNYVHTAVCPSHCLEAEVRGLG